MLMRKIGRRVLPLIATLPLLTSGLVLAEDAGVETSGCHLGSVGLAVHLDPSTGRPTSHPLPEQARALAALQAARANRSTVGLVEERGPTGGVVVNLRDRFRSPLVAVADGKGGLKTEHLNCHPNAH